MAYKTYEEFKEGVKNNYPVRKVVNVNSLNIDLDCQIHRFGSVKIDGHVLGLTKEAFKDLAKTMGLSNEFINKFVSIFGEKAKNKLFQVIKTKLAVNKNKKVAIYVHPKNLNVVSVSGIEKPFISPDVYYKMVDNTLTDNKLEVSDYDINDRGDLKISTLNYSGGWNFGVSGMKDEDFTTGVIITAGPTEKVVINPHVLRLVCQNGMIGPRRLDIGPTLEGTSIEDIQKFMAETKRLQEVNKQFKTVFSDQVKRMSTIKSSYDEIVKLRNLVEKNVTDVTDSRTETVLERFFPLKQVRKEYFNKNIALANLTSRHWKNAKTNLTVWELLNSLTDVASHDYGMGISDNRKMELKKEAGLFMFKKEFDTEFLL